MFSVKKSICLTREYGATEIIYFLKIELLENYFFCHTYFLHTGAIL